MWTCKRCETLNEDGQDFCILCNEPKAVKEEQQRTFNRNNFAANKQQSNQNQQSYDANNPQKEPEPHKKNRLLNKVVLPCVLLLAAAIVIVALITGTLEGQGVTQAIDPQTSQIEVIAPQDDANQTAWMPVNDGHRIVMDSITLTVESTCDYSVNLISTDSALVPNPYNFEGLSFDTNQILIEIIDDSLLIDYFGFLGVPINGAKIQLFNTVDQKQWQATMGDFQASIIFDTLTPGTYYYTVTCEGYETYTSPEFQVTYSSGRDKDNAYMQCILHPSKSELTDGFAIQLTDPQGNPIAMKQMNEAALHPCVKYGSSYRIWSGMSLGNGTNQEGVYEGFQFSLRRGSTAILTFDGITNWDGLDVKDHYILIRAE